jgi:hypothetical protein
MVNTMAVVRDGKPFILSSLAPGHPQRRFAAGLDIMYGPAAPQSTRIKLEVSYTAAQSRIEGAGHEQV